MTVIGRKKLLLIGSVAFGAISVLDAYATSPEMMIVARALLGVAGATLMPATLALIRNLFHDPRERSLAVGIWGATASAGAVVGPVVGGFLLEHFWWGSVFLINLPVMIVLVLVGMRLLPESRDPSPGPWDLPSVGLSLVGVIGVVYTIKEAAAHGPGWDVAAAGVVGALALTWFVRRQLTLPSPLLNMRLFHHRGFSGAVLADLLTILGLSGLVFFLSQFLQLVQDREPLEAGLAELPAAVGAVSAGLVAGLVARRFSVRVVVSGGLAAVGLALAALAWLESDTGYPLLGAVLLVVCVGAGFSFTVTADVILSSVPGDQAGAASAVSEAPYELGAALGIALLGSIVTGVYPGFATPSDVLDKAAAEAHESLGGAVEASHGLAPGQGEALLTSALEAFVDGLRIAASVGAAVLLATAVAAWFRCAASGWPTPRPRRWRWRRPARQRPARARPDRRARSVAAGPRRPPPLTGPGSCQGRRRRRALSSCLVPRRPPGYATRAPLASVTQLAGGVGVFGRGRRRGGSRFTRPWPSSRTRPRTPGRRGA